jgi:hypothetical protein
MRHGLVHDVDDSRARDKPETRNARLFSAVQLFVWFKVGVVETAAEKLTQF